MIYPGKKRTRVYSVTWACEREVNKLAIAPYKRIQKAWIICYDKLRGREPKEVN